jgi:hypothetical protein
LVAIAAFGVLCAASLALAAETTLAEYVAGVEPICKANTQANEKILKGVRAEVRKGQLKLASERFARAATALKKTLTQLQIVPQPPAEQRTLAKWLGYVKTETGLLENVGKKLKAGDKVGTEKMVVRLTRNAELANNTVLDFEFHYCRFNVSKFT